MCHVDCPAPMELTLAWRNAKWYRVLAFRSEHVVRLILVRRTPPTRAPRTPLLVLLIAVALPISVYPWASSKSKSHAVIAERAAACVGEPDFSNFIHKHVAELRAGAVEPDLHKTCKSESTQPCRKDLGISNHYYNLLDDKKGHDIDKVVEEFGKVGQLIDQGKSGNTVAYELGILAHFVSDISQPLHCGSNKTDKNEGKYHVKFEHARDKADIATDQCSAKEITGDIRQWQLLNAEQSAPHYKEISDDYDNNNKLDGQALSAFDAQWQKGVNEVADVFKTIYARHMDYFRTH